MTHTNYRLSFDDAVQVWLRRWNGEYQHEIAASYGVNQGRVNEVLKGKRHFGSEQIAKNHTKH
jgi:predicted XRE-type DNA-binding protein